MKTTRLRKLCLPPLTQKLGPYIKYPKQQRLEKRLAFEHEVMDYVIDSLPEYDFFHVNFDYSLTNWLPFYWRGFEQSTRYTYLVQDLSDPVRLFETFASGKRTDIKKASKTAVVKYDLEGGDFIDYYIDSLSSQGKLLSYSPDFFLRLYDALMENHQGRIIYAVDKDNPKAIWELFSMYGIRRQFIR